MGKVAPVNALFGFEPVLPAEKPAPSKGAPAPRVSPIPATPAVPDPAALSEGACARDLAAVIDRLADEGHRDLRNRGTAGYERVDLFIDPAQRRRLRAFCSAHDISFSALVRALIDEADRVIAAYAGEGGERR